MELENIISQMETDMRVNFQQIKGMDGELFIMQMAKDT